MIFKFKFKHLFNKFFLYVVVTLTGRYQLADKNTYELLQIRIHRIRIISLDQILLKNEAGPGFASNNIRITPKNMIPKDSERKVWQFMFFMSKKTCVSSGIFY